MKQIMKNKWMILFFIVVIVGVCVGFIWFINQEKPLIFTINEKELTTKVIHHEFGEALDLSPKALKLEAKKGNDVCKIQYQNIEIKELKTYRIVYFVKGEDTTFTLKVKVNDTTPPVITGEMNYSITQGDAFDVSHLSLNAMDNYDQDISEQFKMDEVDVNTPGEYDLKVSVTDTSGNEAFVTIHLTIKEKQTKPVSPPTAQNAKTIVSNPNDITVMINKQFALPNGWEPSDLVSINSNGGGNHVLRSEAAAKWEEMRIAAANSGITLRVVSSYRTQSYQAGLYNRYMASDPFNAPYYSAYPRTSEHELGLAIDVSHDWSLHYDLMDYPIGQWMANNSYRYGWILRYPSDKTNITGYTFEPWHYRYVGVSLATALYQSGLTMEEYY